VSHEKNILDIVQYLPFPSEEDDKSILRNVMDVLARYNG